jgi:PAS domain S-box-containing protein
LNLLSDVKLPIYAASEGLLSGGYHDVCASTNGGLWTATSRGVSWFNGVVSSNYSSEAGISVPYIKRAFEAGDGDLYLINGNRDIEILSRGKVVARYANTNWPTAFAQDAHGVVVSVGGELFRVSRNQFVPYTFKEGSAPQFYWIRNLSTCRDRTILVATVNGVFRIGDGVLEHWSVENGLSDHNVLWASEDDQHNVWMALTTGIGRLSGNRIQSLNRDDGLLDNYINAIVPDNHGWIWMNSSRGIFRVSRRNLDDFFSGRLSHVECVPYDGQDAVKAIDTTEVEYTGCRTADGRIWFPSPQGLVMIDPTNLVQNSIAPPVHIERVSVNGVELNTTGLLSAKTGAGELEVQYTGVSFVANQRMQFRYRLDGYDSRWTDAGTRRSAFFTNLKPGSYHFYVQACNADGVWNTTGDQFAIELPPHVYQTAWFKALCAISGVAAFLGLFLGIVGYHQRRRKNLEEANEVLESRIRDRTRELAEQRNLLRTLIDHLPDNVFVKDTQSRVVIDNVAHARMLGFDNPEAAVGRTDRDCFPRDVAEKFFADEQNVLRSGGSYDAEEKILDPKTGDTRWLRTTKVPLRDSTGQIIGLAGIHRDITERKHMEEDVEQSHKQLLQVSRKAGMAEVASSVLHNVGNVLNSVNVSTTVLGDNIRQSKATSLKRAAAMLREHAADLGDYLTKDPKGKKLPDYLIQLGTVLAEEQKIMLKEIDLIRKNVEHIKDIVTTQQTYAKVSGVIEKISMTELVEDALRINANALSRHDVKVTRDFDPRVPDILLDKHKVLQILVNLIRNAKYACDDSNRGDKQLTVRVARSKDQIRVVVADNGIGIPPENLTRIFNHGFTTRKDGHGFGLHSGALAAKEMGGMLTAQSEGPNKGATFILQLPMEHKVASVDPHADAPKIIGDR